HPPGGGAVTGALGPALDDLVDDAVLLGLVGAHEEVAIRVPVHHLDGLAGVVREDLVDPAADPEDLLGVNLDVGGLTAESAARLVDEDPGVGQRVPESGRASG